MTALGDVRATTSIIATLDEWVAMTGQQQQDRVTASAPVVSSHLAALLAQAGLVIEPGHGPVFQVLEDTYTSPPSLPLLHVVQIVATVRVIPAGLFA